jgi:ABC-type transport system involved in multi-copper enzyme maturation permease subunit
MMDVRKLWVVARFELFEAIRSRLFLTAMVLYGGSATIGSYVFIKTVSAAETAARHALATNLGIPESSISPSLIREKALPMFASLIEDESIRQEVLRMPPLSIFYGYMALNIVALLVLIVSTGSIAHDVSSGAARYTLFRCDRLTWATGKLLGQEAVLAIGLLIGALLAGIVGTSLDSGFELITWFWLLRVSFRAWLYANAYLGIFIGVSLVSGSAMKARTSALFIWAGLGILRQVVTSESINGPLARVRFLAYLFPATHQQSLWSPSLAAYLPSALALLAIGGSGFALGHRVFQRRDA